MNEHRTGPDRGPKAYLAGTHRVTDPETTLARLLPLARDLGITRIANVTGLDVVGVPVATAVRPNSRSLAVHQGKGSTLAAAKVSAIMEAAECFHAEFIENPLRLGRWDEMRVPTVDLSSLPRARGGGDPANERLLWIEGRDLLAGGVCWVPYELVHADFTAPQPTGSGQFQATTNGLAAGNHILEAQIHGLCEVIERDAMALWHAAGGGARSKALDLDSVEDPICAGLLRRFRSAGLSLAAWEITSDIGLPTFACVLMPDDVFEVEPELGSGCHADPAVALSRALTEAAQARVTRISGARDDFLPSSFDAEARARWLRDARRWFGAASARPLQSFVQTPRLAGATLRHDLETVLERLYGCGFARAVWVDLTKPSIDVPVGRAIVPGLEGPWVPDGEYVAGVRARAAEVA